MAAIPLQQHPVLHVLRPVAGVLAPGPSCGPQASLGRRHVGACACAASAAGAVLVGRRSARPFEKKQRPEPGHVLRAQMRKVEIPAEKQRGLPPFFCPICRLACTSEKSFQQHLRSKRHLKNLQRMNGGEPPVLRRKKKDKKSPESVGKKAWNKLIRGEKFEECFEEASRSSSFPHKRLVDLLKLAAEKGGANEFAKTLQLVAKEPTPFELRDFHQMLDLLVARVPVPRAMVRLLLNLAVRRPEDLVPLVPPTIGFGGGRHSEVEERDELLKLFDGCGAFGEPIDALDAFHALKTVEIEELMDRVEIPYAEFGDYYPHFLILLVLDFMEELVQSEKNLARTPESLIAAGRLVPEMYSESSDNGKSLVCSKEGPYKFLSGEAIGKGVLLCGAGSDPLHGGVLGWGRIEAAMDSSRDMEGVTLVLNVGGKNEVRKFDGKNLDVYSSVNLIAFERQLEALQKVASAPEKKRFPLWDLLPLSGVGGDILDSWAARMRDAVKGKSNGQQQVDDADLADSNPADVASSPAVLKLKNLAQQGPRLSPKGVQLLETFSRFLGGEDSSAVHDLCDPLSRLNASQQAAVSAAISRQLTVIQGPPGTGKTHVSVEILRIWAEMGVKPVLVTSHNNVAVDNIAEKAYAAGLNVVRLARGDRITSPELDDCTLNSILQEEYPHIDPSNPSERYEACQQILDRADVVCVTTISSASNLVSGKNRKYGAILMDEAAQTTELSALVPIANVHSARLVLVGDHCQLPATALSLEAETRGLTLSLFQRLVSRGFPSYFLDTQFRMHPSIAEHSSKEFYGGKLLTGVKPQSRLPPMGFDWPVEGQGVALLDTQRMDNRSEARDRASWCNPTEAFVLSEILRRILATGELKPWQVGVVTPYMGQVRRLRRAISQNLRLENPRELLVASVDSFQGREKELILFSAVRSNPSRRVGFLADWRRLNVMITRARRGLVIIGDARTLKRDPGWSAYIKWAKNAGYMRQV